MIPLISFVLPTHNRLEFVGECIQSLLEQTEPNIEIIVVNDNSTDGTKEFLDEWAVKDPRVKLFHNEQNMGAGRSRNIGTAMASADIVAVCDDDDVYPEDRAEVTLRWFREHPQSELVNFPYMRIGYFAEHLEPFYGSEFDEKAFKEKGTVSYFCNPSVAFKKSSALEMGGYPSETKQMTDDIQFVKNWIDAGKKIDFDNRAMACLHRVLPTSMMAKQRGFRPEWVGAK
jgi:glycosyltransferase involved in cell wall biosynthesis